MPERWVPPPENVRYLSALLRRRDAIVTDRTRGPFPVETQQTHKTLCSH
ncbi:hypothetical protein [Arsenophonus sp. ENCA]|nr:hypothetical protein [Arsenophonus sp. ENCA]